MDYEKKYLKYKSKYFELRQDLINQGHDVDALMKEAMEKVQTNGNTQTNENVQTGGGDDIFVSNTELSEMNLSDTPNVFDQEGGDLASETAAQLEWERQNPGRSVLDYAKQESLKATPPGYTPVSTPGYTPVSTPAAAPAPNPQKSTTTTNVKNYYNYFDPLYPVSYTVPSYNTVVTSTPLFTVPVNNFPILKRNDDFFLDDDEPVRRRRSSRRSSKRKSSKRKSSKRSSKRRSSRR